MTIPQTATVVLPAGRLTASAVDVEARTIEGILVPWDEVGQPAINGSGRLVKVRRGALQLAAAVTGIDTHDRPRRDVSALVAHEDRPEGMWGRLKVDTTSAGDTLLAAVAAGRRLGLSVEANDLRVTPDVDEVVGGVVDVVAHVDDPAFPSARVHSMTAALCTTPTPTTGEAPPVTAPAPAAPETAPAAPAIDYDRIIAGVAERLTPQLTAAAAPAGLPTGGLAAAPSPGLAPSAASKPDDEDVVMRAARMQAALYRGEASPEMAAALQDITNSNLSIFQSPTGSLGEKLWEGASYQRRFVGMMRQKPLTSWKFTGWRWVQRPQMADYAGDKNDVPSNPVSVDQVEGTASRLAGAWDIDRKFVDFGDAEFWAELYAATAESYLEQSDARAAAALISYAIDVTADPATWPTLSDGTTPAYALPPGFSTGTGGLVTSQAGVIQAVALGTAMLKGTPRIRQAPDYVIMNTFDWLGLVNLTNLDLPAFMKLLGVNPDGFEQHPEVPKGHVILGIRNGATFRELGSTPIRVQAQNVPKGGVDEGCFGYTGISMDKPGAIISVPITEAP